METETVTFFLKPSLFHCLVSSKLLKLKIEIESPCTKTIQKLKKNHSVHNAHLLCTSSRDRKSADVLFAGSGLKMFWEPRGPFKPETSRKVKMTLAITDREIATLPFVLFGHANYISWWPPFTAFSWARHEFQSESSVQHSRWTTDLFLL